MLFYLFSRHHWTPEMYWNMGHGGRDLALALAYHELQDPPWWHKRK